jgi:hypothetical protein
MPDICGKCQLCLLSHIFGPVSQSHNKASMHRAFAFLPWPALQRLRASECFYTSCFASRSSIQLWNSFAIWMSSTEKTLNALLFCSIDLLLHLTLSDRKVGSHRISLGHGHGRVEERHDDSRKLGRRVDVVMCRGGQNGEPGIGHS